MADRIRANYPAMEEMAKHCELVNNRLTQLVSTVSKISQQMEDGVLQGDPGLIFVATLSVLQVKIGLLADNFSEEAKDIRAAESDMQAADSSAAGGFN